MSEESQPCHERPPTPPSWARTTPSSRLHCKACGRVFAAGHLPTDGRLVCAECREDETHTGPTLFDPDDAA